MEEQINDQKPVKPHESIEFQMTKPGYDEEILKMWVEQNSDIDFKKLNDDNEKRSLETLKELQEKGKIMWAMPIPGSATVTIEFENLRSANYYQEVSNSYRFTLHGLRAELINLRALIDVNESKDKYIEAIDHLLKGLQNSIDAGEDITKII